MSLDIALKSPSKLSSQPLPSAVTAQTRITAQKVLQMSYMELLQEGARPEPRLHRLLGHAIAYENASQWYLENKRECIFYMGDKKEKAGDIRATTDGNGRDGLSSKFPTQMQHFRTLSEFQVAAQSQLKPQMSITVNTTEVDADSDDSDSSDSSDETYESDSHDDDGHCHNGNDTRICSYNQDAGIKRVEHMTKTLSLNIGGNNKVTDISMYKVAKGEQDDDRKIWEQQPRVFTNSESEWAYDDMWL
jgi:hypothetical protein